METANLMETTGMTGHEYHAQFDTLVMWDDPTLSHVTRLRLLSDPGFPVWDVSYCHGVLKDGTPVRVGLPFSQLPKKNMRKFIIDEAVKDRVFAKGLKIFDAISTLC